MLILVGRFVLGVTEGISPALIVAGTLGFACSIADEAGSGMSSLSLIDDVEVKVREYSDLIPPLVGILGGGGGGGGGAIEAGLLLALPVAASINLLQSEPNPDGATLVTV